MLKREEREWSEHLQTCYPSDRLQQSPERRQPARSSEKQTERRGNMEVAAVHFNAAHEYTSQLNHSAANY